MNNLFDIKRFGLILKKDFQENGKRYLLYFVALLGVMALVMILTANGKYEHALRMNKTSDPDLNANLLWLALLFFAGAGVLFAATMTDHLQNKVKRISCLTIPASNFEKYFSRWLIVTIGYIAVFFVALWFADFVRVWVCSYRYPELKVEALDFSELVRKDEHSGHYCFSSRAMFFWALSFYFLIQSIFVLGSTFWEKLSFVKTFAVSLLIITAFCFICHQTVLLLYKDWNKVFNVLNSFRLDEKLSESQAMGIVTAILLVFTLLNWCLAYFRFKEYEIIKRR